MLYTKSADTTGSRDQNMKCVVENMLILLTKYKYSSIQQMYKNNAFAKLTNATCPLCYIDFE